MIVLQRFVFDQWVPKKLEIELQVPQDNIDFEKFRGSNGIAGEGEQLLPQAQAPAEEEVEPELNQDELNMVIQMGIPPNAAKHALFNTGNNNADMAVAWYFDNMDNPGKTLYSSSS